MLKTVKKCFRCYRGRNFLSRWARKIFERPRVKEFFGFQLAAAVLLLSVFEPQVQGFVDKQKISNLSSRNFPVIETKTETTLSWPIKNPKITQNYHFGHWGLDIVTRKKGENKRIYPVDKGVVIKVSHSKWAYGNHLIVKHPRGRKSLYAHLKKIEVKKGDKVSRETILGEMGRSGWASGIHLHLEIYQGNRRLNPLTILPKLQL